MPLLPNIIFRQKEGKGNEQNTVIIAATLSIIPYSELFLREKYFTNAQWYHISQGIFHNWLDFHSYFALNKISLGNYSQMESNLQKS